MKSDAFTWFTMSITFQAPLFGTNQSTSRDTKDQTSSNEKLQIIMLKTFVFVHSCKGNVAYDRYKTAKTNC
jgi:hypothetical protein